MEKIVTTQRTSKRYKLMKLIAALLVVFGSVALWRGSPAVGAIGLFALLAAAGLYFWARIGRWWHNE